MRINKYVALATGLSRRVVDVAIAEGRVEINGRLAQVGEEAERSDTITFDKHTITSIDKSITIMFHKPIGYVCSREGQGGKTIYDLLPLKYHHLKPIGRLDKDSSGLLLLTNDGQLAYELTHPKFKKEKVYELDLDKPLKPEDKAAIEKGIELEDGLSKLQLKGSDKKWIVTMHEGRNRQIRRTFAVLGYKVTRLHRTHLGNYKLTALSESSYQTLPPRRRKH